MPELDFERITLNAIPNGDMPVFHASQYETMRPFIADLKWGTEDFAPGEGCWCTMAIRKTDDTLIIIDDIDIVNNEVSCILTRQSVACAGDNFCQLKVWSEGEEDDGCIACLNFILHVQPDPEADGITSESEINNLTEQIEEITQQVIGDDYYTKVQTDDLFDLKADKSTTYTKSEVDTALNLKADKSTTYTKSQVDSALALKADASDVYTKAQTYNKTETDTLLAAKADSADLATVATTGDYDDLINKPTIPAAQIQSDYAQADNTKVDYIKNKPDINGMIAAALLAVMPVDSAGPSAIANFNTELAGDLVDCKTTLTPSLDGYTAVNLTRCGVNLWDEEWFVSSSRVQSKNFIPVTPETTYCRVSPNNIIPFYYDRNKEQIGMGIWGTGTFTTPANCYYIKFQVDPVYGETYNNDISINYPATDTQYHAYNGHTYVIPFGQTVYGGTLDVTRGVLTVNKNTITFNGSEGWYEYARGTDTVVYALQNAVDSILNENDQFSNLFTYNARAFDSSLNMPNIFVLGTSKRIYVQVNISDYATVTAFQTLLSNTNLKVNYNVTPVEIDLGSGTAVTALAGVNNVYSDTGDTTVQFKDSIQHYIDTRS